MKPVDLNTGRSGGSLGCHERRFLCEDRWFVFGLRHLRLSTLSHGRPASRASASARAKVTKVATFPKRPPKQ